MRELTSVVDFDGFAIPFDFAHKIDLYICGGEEG